MTGPEGSGASKIKSKSVSTSTSKKERKSVRAIKLVVRCGLPPLRMFPVFDTWMAVSEETCVFEIIIPPAQPSPTKQPAEKTKTWNHQHV